MIDQIKSLYPKLKLYILPLAVVFSSLVILILVIVPQLLGYFQDRNQSAKIAYRYGVLQAKAQDLQAIDEVDYQKKLQLALIALPDQKQVPQALVVLQSLLSTSGLSLSDIKYSSSVSTTSTQSVQLTMTVAGPITQVRSFLINLKNSPRVFRVETIDSQSIRGGAAVEAEIRLTTFYELPPKDLGSIDNPVPKLSQQDIDLLNQLAQNPQGNQAITGASVPLGKADPFK